MSRDWTPEEILLIEKNNVANELPDMWQFMGNMSISINGENYKPMFSKEEIELRKKFGNFGKLYESFVSLYKEITKLSNGESVLKKAQQELELFIENGEGNLDSHVLKWFQGKLDSNFYYHEHNDELLKEYLILEAAEDKITSFLSKEDIALIDKLDNMTYSEISESIYDLCMEEETFKKIDEKIWHLMTDESSPFSKASFYDGLAEEIEAKSEWQKWSASLYNCDLLYMTAIAYVLGLEIPQTAGDIQIFGM